MPISEFIHESSRIRSVLEARIIHRCLDIVLEPLKEAMRYGVTMPDPLGDLRYCFMPLVSYIADTPEACLVACVRGKTSPVTIASHEDFGDSFRHPSRTAALTKSQLESIVHLAANVEEYFLACTPFRLSGVELPFWRDWPLASPSHFLTPEPLHYWHRASWDHDVSWCRVALGDAEIDFRFSVIPKITGLRHFNKGITCLKQVGGRTQRDVQ
jgi:Plavaka transposase